MGIGGGGGGRWGLFVSSSNFLKDNFFQEKSRKMECGDFWSNYMGHNVIWFKFQLRVI